ncbi:MAG: hypothetical protein JWQ98_2808 [Chlorobi bacterium]|nr:hypothetical protein [Chlorobiota bacterium]
MKFNRFSLAAALILCSAIAVSSCGKKHRYDQDDAEEGDTKGGAAAVVDTVNGATVTGKILFTGTAPAQVPIKQESDPVCAAKASEEKPEVTQEVVINDGKLANVFVYISKGIDGTYAPPAQAAMLDQQGCRYHPHVLGVVAGQKIQFRNSDATLHNIHPVPKNNASFNLAQASVGKVDEKMFDKPEVMIPISCDVHGWMRSYVGVLNHPFFSVSGSDGSFSIKGLPPGTYTITAWHEKFGEQTQEVTVKAKETKDISIAYK